jgi:hypothetical protein
MNGTGLLSPPTGPVALPVGAVYLSLSMPPKIVQTTPEWLDMFALEAQACVGRTINVLVGPDTDMSKFKELLDVVRNHKSGKTRMVLYTAQGDRGLYLISGKPSRTPHGQQVLCKLKMFRSNAIPYKTAAAQDGTIKLIVEAAKPFRIVSVSDEFEYQYGISREEAINRTLGVIQGPETDIRTWLSLLDQAISGISRQTTMQTYTRDGATLRDNMRLTPVLGKIDIEFILVSIGVSPDTDEAPMPKAHVRRHSRERDVRSSSEERDHCAHTREHCCYAKFQADTQDPAMAASGAGQSRKQKSISDVGAKSMSVSMGSVNKMIEIKMRMKQKAKADRKAAQRAAEAEQGQAIAVNTSGGILAFLSSLLMVILVLLHLASPPAAIEFKKEEEKKQLQHRDSAPLSG